MISAPEFADLLKTSALLFKRYDPLEKLDSQNYADGHSVKIDRFINRRQSFVSPKLFHDLQQLWRNLS